MQSHVALLVLAAIAACACFNHDGSSPFICINGGRRRYLVGIAPAPLGALLDAKAVHCAPDGAK